jgi:hypothetical protein
MDPSPDWTELPVDILENRIWPWLDSASFFSCISCCTAWYHGSSDAYSLSISVGPSSIAKDVQTASLERVIKRHRQLRSFFISTPSGLSPSLLSALHESSGATITKLAIPFNGISRLDPERFDFSNWFPGLLDLDVRSWKIPKSSMTSNVFPPTLTSLSLSSCHTIIDESFETLSKLVTGLEHLDIRGIYRLTDKGVLYMLKSNPKITSLDISSLMNLTDAALIGATVFCPKMEKFVARGTKFTDNALVQIPRAWGATLEELSMKMCHNITELGICEKILPGLSNLRNLDLQKINLHPSSSILQSIAQHCPKLTSLDLRDCTKWIIDETAFSDFLQSCSGLATLYLRSANVLDAHLRLLALHARSLVGLYLQECNSLSPNGVAFLFQHISDGHLPILNRVVLSDIPSLHEQEELRILATKCKSVNVTIGVKVRVA